MAGQHLRVFVACGTGLPFSRLLRATEQLLNRPQLELFVQRGTDLAEFAHVPGAPLVTREEFAQRLSWADVVVCHGGAGTLYEAHRAGRRPIAMPRLQRFGEHVNDHQEELVQALAQRELAFWLRTADELDDLVQRAAGRPPKQATPQSATPLTGAIDRALTARGSNTLLHLRGWLRLPVAVAERSLQRLGNRNFGAAQSRRAETSRATDRGPYA